MHLQGLHLRQQAGLWATTSQAPHSPPPRQVVYYHIVKEVVSAPIPSGKTLVTMVSGKALSGNGMIVQVRGWRRRHLRHAVRRRALRH